MTWIILILFLQLLMFAMCAGMFMRVRQDVDFLRHEKEEHLDLVKKFMGCVVTHDGMKEYLSKIEEELQSLHELKDKSSKEKWKKFQAAFGGKEEEKE